MRYSEPVTYLYLGTTRLGAPAKAPTNTSKNTRNPISNAFSRVSYIFKLFL